MATISLLGGVQEDHSCTEIFGQHGHHLLRGSVSEYCKAVKHDIIQNSVDWDNMWPLLKKNFLEICQPWIDRLGLPSDLQQSVIARIECFAQHHCAATLLSCALWYSKRS